MTQIFAFGHSLTFGRWDGEGGWVSRLRRFLDKRSLDDPEEEDFLVWNMGVPGDDTDQLLDRFEDELERRLWPEDTVILIQIGANDLQRVEGEPRVAPADFRQNLKKLVEMAGNYSEDILLIGDAYYGIEVPYRGLLRRRLAMREPRNIIRSGRK